MVKRKRAFFWAAGSVGFLSALLIVLFFLFGFLVDWKPVREKILADLSRKIGSEIISEEISVPLFPFPHIRLRNLTIRVPNQVTATIASAEIYPNFPSLLLGKVGIDKAVINRPVFEIMTSEGQQKKEGLGNGSESPATALKAFWGTAMAGLDPRFSGLNLRIDRGRLKVIKNGNNVIILEDIQANLTVPSPDATLKFTCKSNLWEELSFDASFDRETLGTSGTIHLRGFDAKFLSDRFLGSAPIQIAKSSANLEIRFESSGKELLFVEVKGSIPHIALVKQSEEQILSIRDFKGIYQHSENETIISLSYAAFDYPQGIISGKLLQKPSAPKIQMLLEGENLDISSVRKVSLALLGNSKTTHKVFEVLRSGSVPSITFASSGNVPKELGKLENIRIVGNIEEGGIYIPKVVLNLSEVKGRVNISEGILHGEKLQAKLGNSTGSDGILKLGLRGKAAPLQLSIKVDADLQQLPSLLKRLVKNKKFVHEMELIKKVRGRGVGWLYLGEKLNSIHVKAQLSNFYLKGTYGRLFHPLEIKSGQFEYDQKKAEISWEHAVGTLGDSKFSGFGGRLQWKSEPSLQIKAGNFNINSDEIYPWLISFKSIRKAFGGIRSAGGSLTLDSVRLNGPLLKPTKWVYRFSGVFNGFTLNFKFLPGPITAKKGKFKGMPGEISLSKVQAKYLGSNLNVSGRIREFPRSLDKVDLTIQGEFQSPTIQWIYDSTGIPSGLRLQAPVFVSESRLLWKHRSEIKFSGKLAKDKETSILIDHTWRKNTNQSKKIRILGKDSDAAITFNLTPEQLTFSFKGHLAESTLRKLLVENRLLSGTVRGNIEGKIFFQNMLDSAVNGEINGKNADYDQVDESIRINDFTIKATGKKLFFRPILLTWRGDPIRLEGTLGFSKQGLALDMDASFKSLDWSELKKLLLKKRGTYQKAGRSILPDLQCNAVIHSEKLIYGEYVLAPFEANVALKKNGMNISISRAGLCGINIEGEIKVLPDRSIILLKPRGVDQDLNRSLSCLWEKDDLMKGKFDFEAEINGETTASSPEPSWRGKFAFRAKNGRIYRFGLLEKIFSVVNFTEFFRGKPFDFGQEGFGYESVEIDGRLLNDTIELEEAIIKGKSFELVGQGNIGIKDKKLNLMVLVAPLKTLDVIVSHVPVVNGLLGAIVSVPVEVRGDLDNPFVIPLSPSAVGSELVEIMKHTVNLPLKVIQPFFPNNSKETPEQKGMQENIGDR